MRWKKLGLLITPSPKRPFMVSHAMLPTVERRGGNRYRVYFSGRDEANRSHISYAEMDITDPFGTIRVSENPVLGLGELGCFDDNGVTPSWVVKHGGVTYLYYIGWNPRSTVRMKLFGGLALSEDDGRTFRRFARVPIIDRTHEEPFLNTAPCVLKEGSSWRMWYVSGVEWVNPDLPRYNIKYAESRDGKLWYRSQHVCVDFRSGENALARPCVLKEHGIYKMWYSYKGTAYRLGYAESADGYTWERKDDEVGIDVSDEGWDSKMLEYAYVFSHEGRKFMLYNGNDYGRDGIGMATMEGE